MMLEIKLQIILAFLTQPHELTVHIFMISLVQLHPEHVFIEFCSDSLDIFWQNTLRKTEYRRTGCFKSELALEVFAFDKLQLLLAGSGLFGEHGNNNIEIFLEYILFLCFSLMFFVFVGMDYVGEMRVCIFV